MDSGILDRSADLAIIQTAVDTGRFFFTIVPDLQVAADDPAAMVKQARKAGFRGLTFHSYLQRIQTEGYPLIAELAVEGDRAGMFTGLCTAFGSREIYTYHSLPLAAEVVKQCEGPVILYHCGGARILEAMLLAEAWPNLYLETSFSLSYWLGSTIETDQAFAMRKIGCKRFLFGSDAPFIPLERTVDDHKTFFRRHDFTRAESDRVFSGTAGHLLQSNIAS